jgi:hypothetical protein
MDVESKETIALGIAQAQAALDEVVDRAVRSLTVILDGEVTKLGNLSGGMLQGLQAVEDKAASDLAKLLASLDGWTVEVTIPPIRVRLTAPGKG